MLSRLVVRDQTLSKVDKEWILTAQLTSEEGLLTSLLRIDVQYTQSPIAVHP